MPVVAAINNKENAFMPEGSINIFVFVNIVHIFILHFSGFVYKPISLFINGCVTHLYALFFAEQ